MVSSINNHYAKAVPHQILTVTKQFSLQGSKWVIDSSEIREAKSITTTVLELTDTEVVVKDQRNLLRGRLQKLYI